MNEIKFNIEDTKTINLSMDVGIKEIYPPIENLEVTPTKEQQVFNHEKSYGYDKVTVKAIPEELLVEDLTEELKTYDIELTEQENILDNLVEALKNKGIGEAPKYAPEYISFYNFTGSDLTYATTNLDTSKITDMKNMFYGNTNVKKLDVSDFNTSSVDTMRGMFLNCLNLTSLDLSSFNTSKVYDMSSMFQFCSGLTSLDLSNFDTSRVYTIQQMFFGCSGLQHLDIRNFTFNSVTTYSNAFNNIPTNCEIIVKSDTEKEWLATNFSTLTNVKTVAEMGVS